MNIVLNTDSAVVTHEAGSESSALVTFAGVGSGEKIQEPEFVGTLDEINADCHVFHVIDTRRSWYNETAPSILEAIQPRLQPLSQTITLGSSMGGFGALYFAGRLPHCRRAIAFAPQFSLAPGFKPPFETRWESFAQNIRPHVIDHAMVGAVPTVDYVLFYGARDTKDTFHSQRFMKFTDLSLTIFFVESCGHDVARFIRKKGGLPQLVDLLVAPRADPEAVLKLLSSVDISAGYWRSPTADLGKPALER